MIRPGCLVRCHQTKRNYHCRMRLFALWDRVDGRGTQELEPYENWVGCSSRSRSNLAPLLQMRPSPNYPTWAVVATNAGRLRQPLAMAVSAHRGSERSCLDSRAEYQHCCQTRV